MNWVIYAVYRHNHLYSRSTCYQGTPECRLQIGHHCGMPWPATLPEHWTSYLCMFLVPLFLTMPWLTFFIRFVGHVVSLNMLNIGLEHFAHHNTLYFLCLSVLFIMFHDVITKPDIWSNVNVLNVWFWPHSDLTFGYVCKSISWMVFTTALHTFASSITCCLQPTCSQTLIRVVF